jgi:hypothetical protein
MGRIIPLILASVGAAAGRGGEIESLRNVNTLDLPLSFTSRQRALQSLSRERLSWPFGYPDYTGLPVFWRNTVALFGTGQRLRIQYVDWHYHR